MSELDEVVEKIRAIVQTIERARLPAGIVIDKCEDVELIDNVLVNCGISVKDSKKVLLFANRIDDRRRREVLNLLYELINLLKQQPQNRNKILEVLSRIRQVAEPIYDILVLIDIIKKLLGL